MRSRAPLLVLAPLLLALLGAPAAAQQAKGKRVDCVKYLNESRKVVDDYWSFLIFKVGAFDIPGMVARLRPEAEAATTPDACADVLDRFMASLRDGHANLTYFPGRTPTVVPRGIRLKRFKDRILLPGALRPRQRLYVIEANTGRPELERVPVGTEVLSIDGKPVQEVLDDVEARTSASTAWGLEHWTDRYLLEGPADTDVKLGLRLPDGATLDLVLPRPRRYQNEKDAEDFWRVYGDTVTLVTWKRLGDGFGYIKFVSFAYERAVREFDAALDSLRDSRGLVVDLRDNGGGLGGVVSDLVGRFFKKQVQVARYIIREPRKEYVIRDLAPWIADKRKWTYAGPVVLIVDAGCFSACDIFTNAMDENNRALVLGATATGGGSASPVGGPVFPEWEGVSIRVSYLIAQRKDGSHIESRGVRPHVMVEPTLQDYVAGRDPLLERALEALQKGEARPLAGS